MQSTSRLIVALLVCLTGFVEAQYIEGIVTDETNNPIPGAYIVHLQSDHHAHSNEFGQFYLNGVEDGDTLQVLFLGFETQFVPIIDIEQSIKIKMKETSFRLSEVVVGQNLKRTNIISSIDLITSPVNSSQEILRKVPGLIIGQHAGGGKAEQIFLRGFDVDHGTDIAISADGIPVNMVSHAHGQGYSDLHFIIPETIEQIDFGKGPYYGDHGNFNTAGYVDFRTKNQLKRSEFLVEYGRFNTFRSVGLIKLIDRDKIDAYVATEYLLSDGPFESSQNFSRNNWLGKLSAQLDNQNYLSLTISQFNSQWDASGQIPVRAVEQGLITRFGAIDDTEGGFTSRTNIGLEYTREINSRNFVQSNFFYSLYDFELYSNFTFFLNDPINADQIRQKEDRRLVGFQSVLNHALDGENNSSLKIGFGLRNDQVNDNELSRTRNRRETLTPIQLGNVNETNIYSFVQAEFDFGRFLFQPALRMDFFKFGYVNALDSVYQNRTLGKGILSPKLNLIYNANQRTQLFFKSGIGFHSNDSRVVLGQTDRKVLPAAYGMDLGAVIKPTEKSIFNIALWYLFLEQEFVYVGDEGIVEPSGQSRRVGIDVGLRYQLNDWLFFDGDINYAFARSIEEPEGADYIPLAPDFTATGGLSVKSGGWNGSLKFRWVDDRPANEDNSIVADGYFITDLNASYTIKNSTFGFAIENLFDQDWNETQFATESRLNFESQPIEEIHFTPGTPFMIRGKFSYRF